MPIVPLIILNLGVAIVSVRRSLRPLALAAERADKLSPHEARLQLGTSDLPQEAASLVHAINRMLDLAHNLLTSQRLFVARAAHELRTPLAVMLLELGHSEEPRMRQLQADVRAMSQTVNQLLVLARLESIELTATDVLDTGAIASDLINRLDILATSSGHDVILQINEPAQAMGDATAIREALRNLIENALRHTPAGTRVEVTVGPAGTIVVEDNGPGLQNPEVADLLLPFRQGRESNGGAGLGLAIVQQAVTLHAGTLKVGKSGLGGARFEIDFAPMAA